MKEIGKIWIKFTLSIMGIFITLNALEHSGIIKGFSVDGVKNYLPLFGLLGLVMAIGFNFVSKIFKFIFLIGMIFPFYYFSLITIADSLKIKTDLYMLWTIRGLAFTLTGLTYQFGMSILKYSVDKFFTVLFFPIRWVRQNIWDKIKYKVKGYPPCPIDISIGAIDRLGNGDTYEKGRLFEEYIAQLYRVIGYNAKTTTQLRKEGKLPTSIQERGGSGDQGADVVYNLKMADGEIKKTIIQCKHYSKKVDNKAIQEIVAAKSLYEAHHMVVITNNYFTKPAQDLALANGVTLIDRDRLQEVIKRATKIYYDRKPNPEKKIDIDELVA